MLNKLTQLLTVCGTVILALALLQSGQTSEPSGSVANVPGAMPAAGDASKKSQSSASSSGKNGDRLRENTPLIDVPGTFQSIGADSVIFTPKEDGKNKESLRILENLALERISRTLEENRGSRPGIVSGVITEYRGNNYLLVKKAVFQLPEGEATAAQ